METIADPSPEETPEPIITESHVVEFTLKLQSPEVKRIAADEITQLTAIVEEIREGFITIAAHLADLDTNHFPEQNGGVVECSTEWKGYYDVRFPFILQNNPST